ncbi:MAG: hypothetical protein F4210_06365 [Holophagales bacterium]|nr:hypothetical protein [Holophagales bacterium]MYF95119.1 hypothetical protein [Holophagales bacterium]
MKRQRLTDTHDQEVIEASTEEALAAALNAAVKTGVPVCADPALLARFGIADHGEDLGDLDLVFPDLVPQSS